MLLNIREKAQGWLAWTIVILIGITFVIFGTGSMFSPGREGPMIAKVNNEKLYEASLESAYKRVVNQTPPEQLNQLDPKVLREQILQELIQQLVLNQKLDELGLQIKEDRLLHTLQTLPVFSENGFSTEMYQQFLRAIGMTHQELLQELNDRTLAHQLQQGIAASAMLTDWEVDEFLRLRDQKRDFESYVVKADKFKKLVSVTDQDLEAYYEQNKNAFFIPEKVAVSYIHVSQDALLKSFKPTKEQLLGFYEQNKYLYNDPERVKVAHILITFDKSDTEAKQKAQASSQEILAKLKAGEDFAKLAKVYSDDMQSKDEGGELTWMVKGENSAEFEKAAFSLSKPNELSNVIETEFGFHIIKLVQKEDEKILSYDNVKEDVYKGLQNYWANEKMTNITDDMVALAFDYADTLQPIADKINFPIKTTKLFSEEDGPAEMVLNQPNLIRAAFSHEIKVAGNNSDLIKLDDKNYAVIRVNEYVEQHPKTFAEVKEEIRTIIINQRAIELAQNHANDLLEQINKGTNLSLQWQAHKAISRHDTNIQLDMDMIQKVFTMPKPNGEKQTIDQLKLDNGDIALVKLLKVKDGDPKAVKEIERNMMARFLEQNAGNMEFHLLQKAWEAQADITRL